MEMYDLKPNAPSEYRGEFRPIRTTVPGLDVGELLPLHARSAERFNIVRSIAHTFGRPRRRPQAVHDRARSERATGTVNDFPAVPSQIAKAVEDRKRGVPNYVYGCDGGRAQIDTFAFGSAYLGNSTHPFTVQGNPADPAFKVQNLAPLKGLEERFDDRVGLLQQFDALRRRADRTREYEGLDQFNQQALELITSDKARRAFDLSQEPDAVRNRYGRHAYGHRALLARRLVEAGSTFRHHGDGKPAAGRNAAQHGLVQLGLARGQLPPVRRCQGALPAIRSGDHGLDRRSLRPRARSQRDAGGDGRIRPHAAPQLSKGNQQRRHAARPRPLAPTPCR